MAEQTHSNNDFRVPRQEGQEGQEIRRVGAEPGPSAPRAPPPHHYREAKEGDTPVPQDNLQLHHADLRHRPEAPRHDEEPPAVGELAISTATTLDAPRHLPTSSPSPSGSPKRPNLFVANPDPFHRSSGRSASPHLDRNSPPSLSETLISPRDPAPLSSGLLPVASALSSQHCRQTRDPIVREEHLSTSPIAYPRDRGCSIPSLGFAPKSYQPKSLRPFARSIMALEQGRKFSTGTSVHRKRQMSTLVEKEGHFGPALTVRGYLCVVFPMLFCFDTLTCCPFSQPPLHHL